ncbi:cysteine hydrolase family protein [Rhizobium wenxiniae]|uniref:cysteine hydrolase family protein n=1 Tax=Rhizobium wenxiniae TaxID=1737357 RepID=UPI003C26E194
MEGIGNWRHLCVDMQRMFMEETPWHVGWMARILPQVVEVARRHRDRTVFTRFIPPANADAAFGSWKDYYTKWNQMTGDNLPADLLDLTAPLGTFVPPATIFDKTVYSPWIDGRLATHLRREHVDTLVVTGGETDVCVLATVLGAIDLGFKVIILSDAVCSGADETHDAAVDLLAERFFVQLELATTEQFLGSVGCDG